MSVGTSPRAVAIDSTTNKIYVANFGVKPTSCTSITGGSVTVIDGVTYSTTTTLSGLYGVGVNPKVLAVDEATDQVYVVSLGRRYFKSFFSYLCNIPSSLARIDGQTLSTSSAFLGGLGGASSIALNPATDNIYVSAVAAT
ncbi:MAG TPA: hypothetical protein VG204_10040 [Terriglobia bacterium]|nr:hypothetical protein [Terriglobia bacterium]